MSFYLAALLLGLALCAMGFGIYISLRIFNIPDITTDGSYTLGAAVTAALLSKGVSLPVTLVAAFFSGAAAGAATGLIHTRLRIQPLLAGILVMIALYSVNLSIMGRSNIPLISTPQIQNVFSFFSQQEVRWLCFLLASTLLLMLFLSWLLKTDFGIAMRATGNSEMMVRALGVNTQRMQVIGLALANALTALSGFLVCQYQQFTDINMGIGIVIFGLGSVIMGEALMDLFKTRAIFIRLAGVVIGCIIFRMIIAVALDLGVNPNWLRAVTSVIVLIVVGIPNLKRIL